MARPKTPAFWIEAIRKFTANEPRLGPRAIHKRFEEAVKKVGKADVLPIPGERTIGRVQEEFRGLPDKERQRYRQFRWPEDMQNGLLPWEAGASALELVRWRLERKCEPPLIGQVHWFYRISTLAPDAPFDDRYTAARWLCAFEVAGDPPGAEGMKRSIEFWLAFKPWRRSSADAQAHTGAPWAKGSFPYGLSVNIRNFGPGAGVVGDFLVALDPFGNPEESLRRAAEHIVQVMNGEDEGGSQCEDTSADVGQNGQPSSASGTTKAADESNSGSAASRPRRQRRKN